MTTPPSHPRRLLSILIIIISALASAAATDGAQADDRTDLIPKFHGTLRSRWEMETRRGESRFQVRNARLTLSGNIAAPIDYFIQTDLCDRGKMKILDAWGRLEIAKGLRLQAGQFRIPFGTDCFRAPGTYIFANRSFIGGTLNNVRGVGAKLSYSLPLRCGSRLNLDGGAFNTTSMADHDVWCKQMSFGGKAEWTVRNVKLSAGAETLIPDSVRMNNLSGSATWTCGSWTVEGEYLNKHYTHRVHRAAHGYNLFCDYGFPLRAGVFNRGSVQARFDGMTAHSLGYRDKDGRLTTDNPARNRVTVGATVSYIHKYVRCDLRLDYEKYFYRHSTPAPISQSDKICAEMVIKF